MSLEFKPTEEQNKKLEEIIQSLKNVKGALMPALQQAQEVFGYLPREVQAKIAEGLSVTEAEVYGVVTFYSQFRTQPKGRHCVGVCLGTACYVRGAGQIFDRFKSELNIEQNSTTPDGNFSLEATRCIGCCGLAPVVTVNEEVYGKITPDDVPKIIAKHK